MRVRKQWFLMIFAGLALLVQVSAADERTDHLRDLAKQEKAKGQLDQVANDLCEAADLDPSHYKKKCERARADAENETKENEGYFQTGKFELGHKDYAGAIRDLSKISFGPRREEAQRLIQQAKASLPGGIAANQMLLREAQAAYQRGDFDTAAAQASHVESAALQPAARQLLTNIKIYQDTMAQADLLAQNADYERAKDRYSFAITIHLNGPGAPVEKLHNVEAKLAAQAEAAAAKSLMMATATKPAPQLLPKVNYAAKVKNGLTEARRDEAKRDYKAALYAFDGVLLLDSLQTEALAGKQRVMAELRGDPKALTDSLEDGIRSYYASHFEQATESISLYLSGGGLHNKGAAHFYLAASLLSEAIFSDQHDEAHTRSLQQGADEQFAMAHQENYKPVEMLVSPRILVEWAKSGSQQ